MAGIPVLSSLLTSLEDSSGNSPVLGSSGGFLTLHQRNTAPPALPTLTSPVSIDGAFHNLQQTHPGNFSSTAGGANGTPTLGNLGLRLGPGDGLGLASSQANTWVRYGTWWSEGILSFTPEVGGTTSKQLDGDTNQGLLYLQLVSNQWRFSYVSSFGVTSTFDSITVPTTSNAPGAIPAPFYYRFLRELPSTGNGEIHLVVNDGTTTQTQTITGSGIHQPLTTFPLITTFGTGSGGTLNLYWFRGIGSDTNPTVGALQSTYWTTPSVFSNVSYSSQAASSCLDCGANDQYWWQFGINPGGQFEGITRNGGALVKNRFAANNTGTGLSFSGSYQTLQDIPSELADPQGRYLGMEFRFEPGTEWPLSSGGIHIRQPSTTFGSATHFATASNPEPVPLAVPGEGTSQGTLPFEVEAPVVVEHVRRVHRSRFSFPYSLSRPIGTENRRIFQVRWVLTSSQRDTLIGFFESRDGEQAFSWTAPGDSSTSLAALTSAVEIQRLAPDAFEVRATLTEVK